MTLIIIAGNKDYISLAMDRRLTTDGTPVDEEASKGGIFECSDARLNYGFTGLARVGKFRTDQWILQTLTECGPPNHRAKDVLDRFTETTNSHFSSSEELKSLPENDKRLTIAFAGFLYNQEPPLAAAAIISNYEFCDHDNQQGHSCEFKAIYTDINKLNNSNGCMIFFLGATQSLIQDDMVTIEQLLDSKRPYAAITGKSVDIIRDLADRGRSEGLIGKQILTSCIFSDPQKELVTKYHTNNISHTIHFVDRVVSRPNSSFAVQWKVEAVDPETAAPMAVPKVSRNVPCPCGSGKKYKRCHGR